MKRSHRWSAVALLVLLSGGLSVGVVRHAFGLAEERATATIAVVRAAGEYDAYLNGVQMAVEQVNRQGGLEGRALNIKVVTERKLADQSDQQDVVSQSLRLAEKLGKDDGIVAVIGHGTSATAVPASSVYNQHKKLFISTHATATSLVNHRFDYVFTLQPNNYSNAVAMAQYAMDQGMGRFVILSDHTNYGVEVTKVFQTSVTRRGGQVLHRGYLNPEITSIDKMLVFLMDNRIFDVKEIDGIFVTSSSRAETADFIARARQLGLRMPILGPEYLFSSIIERMAGEKNMKDVLAVSSYDRDSLQPKATAFVEAYRRRFNENPDLLAALGYDAIGLIRHVAAKTGSLDSTVLADKLRVLRYESPYEGVTGSLSFTANGMVAGASAYIVRHDGERFQTAARYPQFVGGVSESLDNRTVNRDRNFDK